MGTRADRQRHASHTLAQYRSQVHLDGRGGLAYLLRCARPLSRRRSDGPHCWRRGDEVPMAAAEYRIRETVRHRRRETKLNNVTGAQEAVKIKITSIFVSDQEKALHFYTGVLGFVKKSDFSNGPFRWLTVGSAEEPNGAELQL